MNVTGFVTELQARGLELWEDAGRLRFRGPPGAMTVEHRATLQAHKQAVLDHLRTTFEGVAVEPRPQDRFEPFPLSDVQSAYLIGRRDVFAYGGVACHAYGELRFDDLDPERMQTAWQAVVERHDMLRAVIDYDGSQRVLPDVPAYAIAVDDLRRRPSAEVDTALQATRGRLDHEVHQPDAWPLFGLRVSLLDDHAILHVSIDFLIADYVSIYLLLDELSAFYHQPDRELPAPRITFRDYLLAERRIRQGPRYDRDREYWLARLDELPGAPELPLLDEPVTSGQARFRRRQSRIPAARWQALRARAGEHGVTASGAVLAAYSEVIGRWSRNPRYVLDLTLLSRLPLHPDVGRVVGDFTSVDLLAVDRTEGDTFAQRAVALGAQLFSDLDHRLFSGVEVLRELARRRGQDAALMPVVFTSAIGLREDTPAAGGAGGELGHGISQTPQVWIDCQVMEDGGALSINWDVREGVFPDDLIDDMFQAFESVLGELADDSGAWDRTDVVALPPAQRLRRDEVNATDRPLPDALLHEAFTARALDDPGRVAVLAGGATYTRGDLLAQAGGVAETLRDDGCRPGDLVAVVLDKSFDQLAAVFGVLLAGGVYVPIDTHQPPERRNRIITDAGITRILTRAPADGWPEGVRPIGMESVAPAALPQQPPARSRQPDDLAYVIYTSGSTGAPKGVMISHRAAVNTIDDINRRFGVDAGDRVLGLANLGFDLSVYDLFGVLGAGGSVVLPDPGLRADPSHWAALVEENAVTLWNTVPAQLHMLGEYLRTADDDLGTLRLALLSGDWIPVGLPDRIRGRLPGLTLIGLGGATEAAIWSIFHPIGEVDPAAPSIPYGTPLANQSFHVLDSRGCARPDLVPGELYIAGAGVATGYLNDDPRTAERFVRLPGSGERAYRTGDVGRYLPDGTIEFLGRDDRQVKIRGYRIELAEVEAALQADPDVAACAVLMDGATPMERRLVAFVEPVHGEPRATPDRAALTAEVESAGAAIAAGVDVPKVVEFARQLDVTALQVMADLLRRHGLFATAADRHTRADIMTATGVVPKHQRLVRRWLAALVAEGWLELGDDGSYRALRLVEPADVTAGWQRVEELLPAAHDRPELVRYFQLAAAHLPELLRDEQDPVQLLFPEGRLDIQEAAYSEGFLSHYLNGLATSTLRAIAGRHPEGAPLRVLEVGAGVGGTSVETIPGMDGLDVRYSFTDVSQFFLNKAAERFADYPWVDYALFDMNEPYREQGLEPNSVDVILCGNVMHYSRDADVVLARMRELLVAGGWLVFIETTRDNYQILTSMEFLFDATNGDFEDVRNGQDQTFIARDQWLTILADAGAETVFCLPDAGDELAGIGMHVFAARLKTGQQPVDEPGLTARLADRVPAEMIPSRLHVVDAMPLTDNGKVDRATLQTWVRPAAADPLHRGAPAGPMSELEQAVAAVWAAVLKTPSVGAQDNFYDLGGDSLLAAQVVTEVREQVPRAADVFFDELLRELLNGGTVAGLAEVIGGQPDESVGLDAPAAELTVLGHRGDDPLIVLVGDGLGGDPGGLAAQFAERGAVVVLPAIDAARAAAEGGLDAVAADAAQALRVFGDGPFHLVGAHAGGVLAAEIAGALAESGAEVADLTVISSFPLPAVVDDDILAEYLLARGAGGDTRSLGYPSEEAMGSALRAVLAASPGQVPAGSFAAPAADPGSVPGEAVRCCAELRTRPEDERLRRLADATGVPVDAVRAALDRQRVLGEVFATHRIQAYAGHTTLLVHADDTPLWRGLHADMERYWAAACLGGLRVLTVPGDHFGCRRGADLADAVLQRTVAAR